jgi:tetratricopeptide (TPR) repeat protein
MYVYRTTQFNQKAERYGIGVRVDDLCVELEAQRIDEVQTRFERVYPYLKRRILNRRLIARILRVDDQELLCLLDIFKRGDNDYQQFLESPRDYGRIYLESSLNPQELRDWLQSQKTKQQPVEPLPELPTELHPWLETPGWEMETVTGDWIIYESEEWVRRFKQRDIQTEWETYYQAIAGIRDKRSECEAIAGYPHVKLASKNNCYVLFSEIETADTAVGGVLFLLAPFHRQPSPEEVIQVGVATALFDGVSSSSILSRQLSLEELTPYAQRSYPAYLLADEESWLAIERGKEANLALSPEEEKILKSVSTSVPGEGALPIFINGRAGSGKSTMLLYLFADYCYRKFYDKQGHRRGVPLPGEPLFLTYNERLLDVAKQGVQRLLSSHHRFVAERTQKDQLPNINSFFQPFQKFLLNLLPAVERDRFDLDRYISFHRFKQLYQGKSPPEFGNTIVRAVPTMLQLPQARKYSPELAWHIIRTFIKGALRGECMTPEDYLEEVPRKEQIISIKKYQGIYETIWERWYQRITEEQGYWDDQDLIARVLELKCYPSEYVAIFCDEAQDFTRLELQLIMRLSVFSRYHLGYQPLNSLPFAFAGDPFQTLNPAGFHWSSVQAVFDAEVITALDPSEQLKLVVNFQELAYNYRSSPPIVKLTNLIQFWRRVLFDIAELQPQTAWQQGNFPQPQKFIVGETIAAEELKNYIKDTIIIVPCEEGEEVAYVQSDPLLGEIYSQEVRLPDSGIRAIDYGLIKNVLSAIAAKGLEFKRVILYKFGQECDRQTWQAKREGSSLPVQVEYFFNKLYVAASRATERLFVVDSPEGDRLLWQHASKATEVQELLRQVKNPSTWEGSLQLLETGTAQTAQEMREDDPEAIAQEFETKGLNSENPSLLRRARQFYRGLGDTAKADYCEAWALKFEAQFQEAGRYFLQVGELEAAWQCFWQGKCWEKLVEWCWYHPEVPKAELPLALFMTTAPQNQEAVKTFTQFLWNTGFVGNLATEEPGFEEQGSRGAGEQGSGGAGEQGRWSDEENILHPSQDSGLRTQDSTLSSTSSIPNPQSPIPKQWLTVVAEYAKRIEALLPVAEFQLEEWQQLGIVLEALESAGYSGILDTAGTCFYRGESYANAVRCWESGGVTQTRQYNKAKAAVLGMPAGLEYLARVEQLDDRARSERLISEWQQAGKPRTPEWLNYVAPTLEALNQYSNAFITYTWLDRPDKVKAYFEKANGETQPLRIKPLRILLRYYLQHQHWEEAIAAMKTYLPTLTSDRAEQVGLKFDVVYELACSQLTPAVLTKELQQSYENFLKTHILNDSNWQHYLSMPQLGIALEKVGSLIEALTFYENFVGDRDSECYQFARERWLATKTKQCNDANKQGKIEQSAKIRLEIVKNARQWSIATNSLDLEPPAAPQERPETVKLVKAKITALKAPPLEGLQPFIQGLPAEITIEQFDRGITKFEVRHLIVKVMSAAQQVLIKDALNEQEVRVDFARCQVNIGDAIVSARGGNQLSFTLFKSGYGGVLVCGNEQPRLELSLQGLSEKITIELRAEPKNSP